ncbi:GIP, partial [Symbiodinium necroappetens]
EFAVLASVQHVIMQVPALATDAPGSGAPVGGSSPPQKVPPGAVQKYWTPNRPNMGCHIRVDLTTGVPEYKEYLESLSWVHRRGLRTDGAVLYRDTVDRKRPRNASVATIKLKPEGAPQHLEQQDVTAYFAFGEMAVTDFVERQLAFLQTSGPMRRIYRKLPGTLTTEQLGNQVSEAARGEKLALERCQQLGCIFQATENENYEYGNNIFYAMLDVSSFFNYGHELYLTDNGVVLSYNDVAVMYLTFHYRPPHASSMRRSNVKQG